MYKTLVSFICLAIVLSGCASAPKRESITAYRTFDVPANVNINNVVAATKKAMSVRADGLTATTGMEPDTLPEKPGKFSVSVRQASVGFGMSFAMPVVKCADTYSLITNVGGFSSGGSSETEAYTGCIYPYKTGTSVQIVLIATTTHSGGLQGMMNSAIKGVFGGNEGTAETYLDQISTEFLKDIPSAKLAKTSKPVTTASSK